MTGAANLEFNSRCRSPFCLQLLPALFRFVGHSFQADPEQLGTLTFSRAVVQALASPLAGILGHYVDRV